LLDRKQSPLNKCYKTTLYSHHEGNKFYTPSRVVRNGCRRGEHCLLSSKLRENRNQVDNWSVGVDAILTPWKQPLLTLRLTRTPLRPRERFRVAADVDRAGAKGVVEATENPPATYHNTYEQPQALERSLSLLPSPSMPLILHPHIFQHRL
jgi:hypothetical protein